MTNVERMRKLHAREQEAFLKYKETNDARYLKRIKQCIDERLKLMNIRASGFNLESVNEKER